MAFLSLTIKVRAEGLCRVLYVVQMRTTAREERQGYLKMEGAREERGARGETEQRAAGEREVCEKREQQEEQYVWESEKSEEEDGEVTFSSV